MVKAWLILILLSIASAAQAEIITANGWAVGDARLTRDTATSLDWLDLVTTDDQSINNIVVDHFGNLDALGFRLATLDELVTFFAHLGVDNPTVETTTAANIPLAQHIIDLVGCTSCQFVYDTSLRYVEGQLLSPTLGTRFGFAQVNSEGLTATIGIHATDQAPSPFALTTHMRGLGVFLIRDTPNQDALLAGRDPTSVALAPLPVPEPASMLLLGTGLAGIWRRRRR